MATFELAIDKLNQLVKAGWHLTQVECLNSDKSPILLPVEVFDAESFQESFKKLEEALQEILEMP